MLRRRTSRGRAAGMSARPSQQGRSAHRPLARARGSVRRHHNGQASPRDGVVHRPVVERRVQMGGDVDPCTAHAPGAHGAHVQANRHPVAALAHDVKGPAAVDEAVQPAPIRGDHDGTRPRHVGGASASGGRLAGGRGRRCPSAGEVVRGATSQQEREDGESSEEPAHDSRTSLQPSRFPRRVQRYVDEGRPRSPAGANGSGGLGHYRIDKGSGPGVVDGQLTVGWLVSQPP